jgi:hypothetical protein
LGLFDRRILAVLKDRKPRKFQRLLRNGGVLSQHVEVAPNSFGASGLVMKEKKPQKGP